MTIKTTFQNLWDEAKKALYHKKIYIKYKLNFTPSEIIKVGGSNPSPNLAERKNEKIECK